jgi:hypothetical protein
MLASRVRATGELVPARWLDAGLVVGLLVAVIADARLSGASPGPMRRAAVPASLVVDADDQREAG